MTLYNDTKMGLTLRVKVVLILLSVSLISGCLFVLGVYDCCDNRHLSRLRRLQFVVEQHDDQIDVDSGYSDGVAVITSHAEGVQVVLRSDISAINKLDSTRSTQKSNSYISNISVQNVLKPSVKKSNIHDGPDSGLQQGSEVVHNGSSHQYNNMISLNDKTDTTVDLSVQIREELSPLINSSDKINGEISQNPPALQKALDKIRLDVKIDLRFILNGPPSYQQMGFAINKSDNGYFLNDKVIHDSLLKAFINTPETWKFNLHAMNANVSRNQPLIREVQETRNSMCIAKYHQYTHSQSIVDKWAYKKVSIVVPFHNEEYSIFLRGLHSIYQQTPMHLLHEVILVDDYSTFSNLKEPFENYVSNYFPRLKLYRTYKRQGLIRSRLLGAMAASGDVLVFLDAHIECQKNWLEPLLDIINNIPSSVAIPTIDYINPNSLTYNPWSRTQYGSFTWELDYLWKDIPYTELPKDGVSPIPSPTMIGCAMAIATKSFFTMGAYDDDMWIWGGENLELSFRAWMCGGGLHTSPCSHIGHLFRTYLPYSFPSGGVRINQNLQRVAEMWMGRHKKYYYSATSQSLWLTQNEILTLGARKAFMNNLNCKSFDWYLSNIAKDLEIPPDDAKLFGQLKNFGTVMCFFYTENTFGVEHCGIAHINQTFYYSLVTNQIVHINSNYCFITVTAIGSQVTMAPCNITQSEQRWEFIPITAKHVTSKLVGIDSRRPFGKFKSLKQGVYNLCLSAKGLVAECNAEDESQNWIFTHKFT